MSYIFKNTLKENLRNGKAQLGAFVTAPCPEIVEALGLAGYDFVVLDTEHTASGIETVVNMMRGAEIYGMTPIVRVYDSTPKIISRYQDVGAHGIQVPMVHTAEQAEAFVKAVKFPPAGVRGMSGGRGPRWGRIENYREVSDRETLVAVMCESLEGLANIDAIAQVPGVDAVFIGAFDLSQALGVPGDTTHPLVEEAIETILRTCQARKVVPGIVTGTVELTRKRIAQGFLYITILDDMAFFAQAVSERLGKVKA